MTGLQPPYEDVVLELRGVHKHFGGHTAVASLDLALRRHEFLTFLGPSGSGKTTTLMMVAGLQRPDEGAIILDGNPIDRLPSYRRDIGMVFQHYALFPHMSVRRNVAFPLEMRRTPRAQAAQLTEEALRQVGLAAFADRLPRQLSGGQQQRVALARAMVYSPALLLMDEPLGALDRQLREQLQLEIKRVHRERRMSVLYVTHDQEEALTMSDRIAVFNDGRVEQIGTPEELYEHPTTRFVAGFIGQTNFFPGRIVIASAARCTVDVLGVRLEATAREALREGDNAVVAVRPERMHIHAQGQLPGELIDVIYLGNARKYVVRLATGAECFAQHDANAAETGGLRTGARVGLSWAAHHATAFPALA